MKLFGPLLRSVAAAGLAMAMVVVPLPSLAGPAELALLESYIGSWRGTGKLIAAEPETVRCHLNITKGNRERVNYSGRCGIAGNVMTVNGTMAYVDSARRFEAAMTTNAGFSPDNAIGRRQGSGILFSLRERGTDDEGNNMTITASMLFQSERITVDFNVLFNNTGESIKASVPFSK
jgi:hypothetical protein